MYVCEELDGKKEGKKWCHKVTAMKYVDFWLLSSPVVKFLGVILEHVVVNHSFFMNRSYCIIHNTPLCLRDIWGFSISWILRTIYKHILFLYCIDYIMSKEKIVIISGEFFFRLKYCLKISICCKRDFLLKRDDHPLLIFI